jgi:hypothetical protein
LNWSWAYRLAIDVTSLIGLKFGLMVIGCNFLFFGSLSQPSYACTSSGGPCCSCIRSVSGPWSLQGREGCGISGTCLVGGREDYGIGYGISCMCLLGGGEDYGSSGKWWSKDGKSTSPYSTTPSKC